MRGEALTFEADEVEHCNTKTRSQEVLQPANRGDRHETFTAMQDALPGGFKHKKFEGAIISQVEPKPLRDEENNAVAPP